jgi:hypothetical protein
MSKNALFAVTLVIGSSFVIGCGYHPYLVWNPAPPAAQAQGKVAVQMVPNKRPPKHGAEDVNKLGNQRNGWGIPFAIELPASHETLDADLAKLVTDAAQAAGIGATTVQDKSATAHLSVEITEFWCDGYPPAYKAGATLNVVFLDPGSNGVRMTMPVHAEDGGWDCRTGYRGVMKKLYSQLVTAFAQPPVHAAALGAAPGAPAAPAPAAPAGR